MDIYLVDANGCSVPNTPENRKRPDVMLGEYTELGTLIKKYPVPPEAEEAEIVVEPAEKPEPVKAKPVAKKKKAKKKVAKRVPEVDMDPPAASPSPASETDFDDLLNNL